MTSVVVLFIRSILLAYALLLANLVYEYLTVSLSYVYNWTLYTLILGILVIVSMPALFLASNLLRSKKNQRAAGCSPPRLVLAYSSLDTPPWHGILEGLNQHFASRDAVGFRLRSALAQHTLASRVVSDPRSKSGRSWPRQLTSLPAPMIIQHAETDEQIAATYEVMRQLRPHLVREDYVPAVRALMASEGFRLAALIDEDPSAPSRATA